MASESNRVPPRPVTPPEPRYSLSESRKMVGKTVASVEHGLNPKIPGVHLSELIVIRFTDGTALAIRTGSNAANILHERAEDFHVDFMLEWFS